ncbi:MAG: hypothetical protein IPH75_00230 [bacterium]|nr:hypothetical protein [bacterium]
MESSLNQLYANGSLIMMSGLVAAALFFVMVGIRELRDESMEGILYLVLGAFFFCAHFYYLMNLPDPTPMGGQASLDRVWGWLSLIFAPALIGLFLLIGLYNFIVTQVKLGLTKMFFGFSLVAYLYLIGGGWAIDIKGILTVVWTMIWFNVELETAN